MVEDFNSLVQNDTWRLLPCRDDMNLLSCKWIYQTKYNSDGSIDRSKTHLIVRDFSKPVGLDYNWTFSPIMKPVIIRSVLTLAVTFGWVITQLDVKNIILHGDLHEDVYMIQPQGLVHLDFLLMFAEWTRTFMVWNRSPRTWFHKFSSYLLSLGLTCSQTKSSEFILR